MDESRVVDDCQLNGVATVESESSDMEPAKQERSLRDRVKKNDVYLGTLLG